MKSSRLTAAGLILLLLAAGCDSTGAQDEFAEDASRAASGITEINEAGEIVSEDEDDWRTAPIYSRVPVTIDPARPNPVAVDDFITIDVFVGSGNQVRPPLRAHVLRPEGLSEPLDLIEQAGDFGNYVFIFSAASLGPRGLHRIYIFDGVGEIVSYGDVLVQ